MGAIAPVAPDLTAALHIDEVCSYLSNHFLDDIGVADDFENSLEIKFEKKIDRKKNRIYRLLNEWNFL